MMAKTATARARVHPDVKKEAERILTECGLTASQGIELFYRQVILSRGLPFPVQSYNAQTRRVLKESEDGVDIMEFDSAEALFEDLGL
jgi:DNA-damage-inducible protein J